MTSRPELRVEVEQEDPLEQSLQGVLLYPVLAEITVRWHFGDTVRALEALDRAYIDAKAQIELTRIPAAAIGDPT